MFANIQTSNFYLLDSYVRGRLYKVKYV